MSADNYIAVKRIKNRWAVWMDFASNDKPDPLQKGAKYYRTHQEALDYALNWYSREVIVEYGVVDLDDERQIALLKEEKNLDKKEVYSVASAHILKEEKSIFDMKLHELIKIRKNIFAMKVCGGWLYKWGDSSPAFVPDNSNGNIPQEVDE